MENCFGHYAQKYFELGMNVLPIGENKMPPYGFKWGEWQDKKQTQEDIDALIEKYNSAKGIAIVCGPMSGVVGFDFDYKYDATKMNGLLAEKEWEQDARKVELILKETLPPMMAVKKGKVGWTVFYKWQPGMTKSIATDRNNVRLFDFKATGYVVMPPSLHSVVGEEKIHYKWLTPGGESQLLEISEITVDHVLELSNVLSNGRSKGESLKNSRHGRLFLHGISICKIEQDNAKVVEALIEKDKQIHKADRKGPYFEDASVSTSNPKRYARAWVERMRKYVEAAPKQAKPENETWDYFIENQFADIRKDVLSKKVMTKRTVKDDWIDIDSLIPVMRAYAKQKGLPKDDVNDQISRFIYENKKDEFLCDIPEWDGIDHTFELTRALRSPIFSHEEISDIFKRWGSRIFGRVQDSDNQNECIILKGKQNIGKDTFVKALLRDFTPYYMPVIPPDSKKDMLEIVSRLYVCHIEEFDQTGEVDVAFLKALITQSTSFFREAYGRGANKKTMATSFISSVNPDDFFRDPTGNRRFVVLPLDSIEFNYNRRLSSKVLSQWRHLWANGGHQVSADTQRKVNEVLESFTPEDPSEVIVELYLAQFPMHKRKEQLEGKLDEIYTIGQGEMQSIVESISKSVRMSQQRIRSILKAKGYQRRTEKSRRWVYGTEHNETAKKEGISKNDLQ